MCEILCLIAFCTTTSQVVNNAVKYKFRLKHQFLNLNSKASKFLHLFLSHIANGVSLALESRCATSDAKCGITNLTK
jgi:hypothetical protein